MKIGWLLTFKSRHHAIMLAVLAVVFFGASSLLAFRNPAKFSSPDETATFVVARQVIATGQLSIPAPLTAISSAVSPRSFSVRDNELVPAGFLGLPLLYGQVARVIGDWSLLLLTPLLSSLGLIVFYSLIRKIFGRSVGLLSAGLLAIHPAFWYWSSRGMFHNAVFLDALMLAVLCLTNLRSWVDHRSQLGWYAAFGASFGLAALIRPSEMIWVVPMFVMLGIVYRRQVDWRVGIWIAGVVWASVVGVLLYQNIQLYYHPFSFGYAQGSLSTVAATPSWSQLAQKLHDIILPFGVVPERILATGWMFLVQLVWLPTGLAAYGFSRWLRSDRQPGQRAFAVVGVLISIWLLIVYGSFAVNEQPDIGSGAIATSYTRYWLPIYAAMIPFAAFGLSRLFAIHGRNWAAALMVLGLFASSVGMVLTDRVEGLLAIRTYTQDYRRVADRAVAETPSNSVIVAGRADKIFFPERQVISREDAADVPELVLLSEQSPLYLYLGEGDSLRLARDDWGQRGWLLLDEIELTSRDRLYPLAKQSSAL